MRSENIENVIVIAIIFIRKGFLEHNENYSEATKMILDSH
jgi:hypothetical protein